MLKIAITGNIASGKTTIETILTNKGFQVYDTDKIAHDILKSNTDVKKIFGTTDRKSLSKIVFSDKTKLKQLESIIHPLVKEKIEEIFNKKHNIVFISVPQLFETNFDKLFDKTIFITSEKEIRLTRLMKRNNLSKEEALLRINAQDADDTKIKKANYVITNNSSTEDLEEQLNIILQKLTN